MSEPGGGSFVEHHDRRAVHLDDRGWAARRERTFQGAGHRRRLKCPGGEEHEAPSLEDGPEPLGDAVRRLLLRREEARVVGFRLPRQSLDTRARRQGRAGLVEAEVAVPAQSQDLHIHSSTGCDEGLERVGGRQQPVGIGAGCVRDVKVFNCQAQRPADLPLQRGPVRLRVRRIQTDVLVESERSSTAEVGSSVENSATELVGEARGSRSGLQSQHGLPVPER